MGWKWGGQVSEANAFEHRQLKQDECTSWYTSNYNLMQIGGKARHSDRLDEKQS